MKLGVEVRVTVTKFEESVVCTLPEGREIEIIMVAAKGEDCKAVPRLESAPAILAQLDRCGAYGLNGAFTKTG